MMANVEPYAYAARRDASWLERPDTTSVKVWHVDRGNGLAACASPYSNSSRCNPYLDISVRQPVGEVAQNVRCRRPGCRVHWPRAAT